MTAAFMRRKPGSGASLPIWPHRDRTVRWRWWFSAALVHRQAGFDPAFGAVDVERQMAVTELGQLLEDDRRVRGTAVGVNDDLGRLVGQGSGCEVGDLVRGDIYSAWEVHGLEVGRSEGVDENHRGEVTDQVFCGQLTPRGPIFAQSW